MGNRGGSTPPVHTTRGRVAERQTRNVQTVVPFGACRFNPCLGYHYLHWASIVILTFASATNGDASCAMISCSPPLVYV